VDDKIANNPGPLGETGENGASVKAELEAGVLTVCNNAGTEDESCTNETVKGPQGERGATGARGADGSSGVSGYEIYESSASFASPHSSGTITSVSKICPSGKTAMGGGGRVTGGGIDRRHIVIGSSYPGPQNNRWTVGFYNASDAAVSRDGGLEYVVYITCVTVN